MSVMKKICPQCGQENNYGVNCVKCGNDFRIRWDLIQDLTQKGAYLAGFVLADGCIDDSANKNIRISIGLKNDKNNMELLNWVKKEFNISNKISEIVYQTKFKDPKYNKIGHNIHISFGQIDDRVEESLFNLGIRPRKSEHEFVPTIPKEFFGSWLRGYFDGDGSIMIRKNNTCFCLAFTAGSYGFLYNLGEKLKEHIDNCSFSIRHPDKNSKTHHLTFDNFRNISQIANIMYEHNDFCLERKYNKFVGSGLYSNGVGHEELFRERKIKRLKRVSGFFGVTKTKWETYTCGIKRNNKYKHIGSYKTAIEAAKAYDDYLVKIGESPINFPNQESKQ